jgi:hypothetical protein
MVHLMTKTIWRGMVGEVVFRGLWVVRWVSGGWSVVRGQGYGAASRVGARGAERGGMMGMQQLMLPGLDVYGEKRGRSAGSYFAWSRHFCERCCA